MLLWFVLGLGLLVLGADLLVRGASRLAAAFGISPLVIGLTVVAFGTSAPELAVSVGSAAAGSADVAVGNVLGSNIFNVLLILGLSALITPLSVEHQLVRRDVPLMIALSGLTVLFAADGAIGRVEGAVFVLALVAYTIWSVRVGRAEGASADGAAAETARGRGGFWADLLWIGVGLAMLVVGADWLVDAAVTFARAMEIDEVVVGLTVVAAGTSLPEVATSVVAAVRGQRDIAVGNVVGSNLFNLMGVLGVAGVCAPDGLPVPPSVLAFDLPVMVAVAVSCLPIFATGHRIDRWEGGFFLAYYAAYTGYVVLAATAHGALAGYSWAMVTFVMPITLVTLAALWLHAHRRRA